MLGLVEHGRLNSTARMNDGHVSTRSSLLTQVWQLGNMSRNARLVEPMWFDSFWLNFVAGSMLMMKWVEREVMCESDVWRLVAE